MGEVIEVRFEDIVPSERGIRIDNIRMINIRNIKGIQGLPAPFKKSECMEGKYIAIDSGNSRIMHSLILGLEKARIYLAESDDDIMLASIFPGVTDPALYRTNCAIQDRWDICEEKAKEIVSSGIENYRDYYNKLLVSYPYLASKRTFCKYLLTPKGRETLRANIGKSLDLLVA